MKISCGLHPILVLLCIGYGSARNAYIKVYVSNIEGGVATPLAGASVQCFDEDWIARDDQMTAAATTDENGEAVLQYRTKDKSTLWKPTRGWDTFPGNSNPDVYCKITKTPRLGDPNKYYPVFTSTKRNFDQRYTAAFHHVRMYPDRVRRGDRGFYNGWLWAGLLPGGGPKSRRRSHRPGRRLQQTRLVLPELPRDAGHLRPGNERNGALDLPRHPRFSRPTKDLQGDSRRAVRDPQGARGRRFRGRPWSLQLRK